MKLFNDIYGETYGNDPSNRLDRRDHAPRPIPGPNPLRDENPPPPTGNPLRFDLIDDVAEDHDPPFEDPQDDESNCENVDVQAILFYGYSGRRCFPSIKPL
jgi:hypothetical protein